MRYLSVCSGVEAASVAWHDLGWTPVGFSEIEPFPSAVLAHRFPSVKNYGDMTKYKEWDIEPGTVDVLVGGTPCQSFSVAGLRKGLDDPRGNLMLVFFGIADHLKPDWLVWENVPGVLSSGGGRDFGSFLGALGELGYRWAYRVLDAQYVGGCSVHGDPFGRGPVPQRRRRVFVVASSRDGANPAEVLSLPESLRRYYSESAQAKKVSAAAARKGAKGRNSAGPDARTDISGGAGGGLGGAGGVREVEGPFWNGRDIAEALTTTSHVQRMPDKGRLQMVVQPTEMRTHEQEGSRVVVTQAEVAGPLDSNYWKGPGSRQGGEREYVGVGTDFEVAGGLQAVGFDSTGSTASVGLNLSPTLSGSGVAGNAGHHAAVSAPPMAVRRLLPVECERLQGFPDDWTNIPWRGKPAPDGPRYKAMGNSMAVPVMSWIGRRLDRVAKGDL